MGIFNKLFGDSNEKVIKEMQSIIDSINALENKYEVMSDGELRGVTGKLRERLGVKMDGRGVQPDSTPKNSDAVSGQAPLLRSDYGADKNGLDEVLPDAFAAAREAARRVLGQRHYDVQLVGGIVLHRGQIAEMKTGEGKTLVATLPLYLNALAGVGAQLITVNDYLSRVGAGWMGPVYYALGMSTGVIVHDSAFIYDPEHNDESVYDPRLGHFRPVHRREAYACDIVYGTNNEFGFDYLRDNMVPNMSEMVQRELSFVIVDEVDSILIDEARTPLIISAPAEESTDKYNKFAALVRRLKENEDYNVDEKMRAATLTEGGITRMEKWLGVENIYTVGGIREVHHIEQALKAHTLFKLDCDYVVKDGEVIIVDEFTGRLMHGRRYSEGLHQAIEAKENVKIQRESQTLATITFQNYFRMYEKLSGMTGTAATEAEEFSKIYSLETVIIPTNKPCVRKDENDYIYRTETGKFKAVIEEIKKRTEAGQPVLVGTISIEKNEMLAGMMERAGLHPQILNAKNHEKEAKFIANAGKPGAITIATNMAGRGVDIILGGQNSNEEDRKKVREDGGLHVIGTERHESRRIDNQLRGRAGRMGDAGSSRFFVSMEDDLMRIFGGDRMKNIMTTLRVPEDMPIENKLISRSIESAQVKVEGNNFDMRKHLVEYDDVINKHREAIYKKRREVLELSKKINETTVDGPGQIDGSKQTTESNTDTVAGSAGQNDKDTNIEAQGAKDEKTRSLSNIILDMIEQEIEQVVSFHTAAERIPDWDLEEVYQVATTIFPVEEKLKSDLSEYVKGENYKLEKAKARTAIIEHLVKMSVNRYNMIKDRALGAGLDWAEIEKAVLIRSIDTLWVEHLEAMSSVRQGIGLRGYGQRDPLIEYKKEAYRLFNELNNLIQKEVVYSIYKIGMAQTSEQEFSAPSLVDRAKNFSAPSKTMDASTSSFSGYKQADQGSGSDTGGDGSNTSGVREKVKDEDGNKVGRNDPCPCGSGKKYKKCHGK